MSVVPYPQMPMTPIWDPARESRQRTAAIVWLGILLVVGFAMPLMAWDGGNGKLTAGFLNIEALGHEGIPGAMKFAYLYPGVAGLVTIILAVASGGVVRSIGLVVLGAFPIVFYAASSDARAGMHGMQGLGSLDTVVGVFSAVAWFGIFVGCRVLRYRGRSVVGAAVATTAGALYVATLVIPMDHGGGVNVMMAEAIIDMLKNIEVVGAPAIALLVQVACMALASLLCLLMFAKRPSGAGGLAGAAFTFFVFAVLAIGFQTIYVMFSSLPQGTPGGAILASLAGFIKGLAWVYGLLLLIPVGLADLLVNVSRSPAEYPGVTVVGPGTMDAPMAAALAGMFAPPAARVAYPPPVAPVAPPPARPAPASDPVEQKLAQVRNLFEQGLISREEYEQKRQDILEQI